MRKIEKKVKIKHLNHEYPLSITIIENPHNEKTKSGFEVCHYMDYTFECTFNNTHYQSKSRDDAFVAFENLKNQLGKKGYMLRCCGNCINYYSDWTTRKWYGDLWGFCFRGQDWKKAREIENIRYCGNYCSNQILREEIDYAVFIDN